MGADMAHIESALAQRAADLGVEIRRGVRVTDLEQTDEVVSIGSRDEAFLGHWVIGCDGGRSTVRELGSFEFGGTDPEFTGYSVQVELANPEKLLPGRNYTPTGMYFQSKPGTIAMVDFDGGTFHRSQPTTLEHVQEVLRRVSGTDVTVTALLVATTWTDRAFQATSYRNGRVLLAGDAAHIHSPLGGQGLNLGLGDAMNLGWKLAAVVRGDAPGGLLDSYQEERHPVGAQVLDWSRAQVGLMRPSPSSRALASIVSDLIQTDDGATYFAERVWAVSLRYNLGPGHPLVGRSTPDFELTDGIRVGGLLNDGKGLLLDFDAATSLQSVANRWSDRVKYVTSGAKDRLGFSALLVRPDGFVAWASDGASNADEVGGSLLRWFGNPLSS
jgi:2-polyprenyl-6-methoxyphenol hydroxylase-like FAD-dependent oxidoreductase